MWKDQINIINKLSFSRVWNVACLYDSFLYAICFKKTHGKELPYAGSIGPRTACNLGCPECASGLKQFTRLTGGVDLKVHQNMLVQLGTQLFYINYYFQ